MYNYYCWVIQFLSSIPSKLHLLHHVIHLVCIDYILSLVRFRHTLGYTFPGVVCRLTLSLLKVGWVVIHQPLEMLCTSMHLTEALSVLVGESQSNHTRKCIIFQARSHPHSHRMLLMCGSIPLPFSIFGIRCMLINVYFLIGKIPSCIEHLANFQLDLDYMLIA